MAKKINKIGGNMKKKIVGLLNTKPGSVLNVAVYIAVSGATAGGISALTDYFAKLDLTSQPYWFVTAVGVINLILVAIKQKKK
jgi:hypothetical protein